METERLVLTVTRYSEIFYTKKGSFRKKKKPEKSVITAYDPSKYRKYDNIDMAKGGTMYTYIIKDTAEDLFKIGRTRKPLDRFRSLCEYGKIYPVALLSSDVEQHLHKRYAANRRVHSRFKGNGGTEWFCRGGIIDELIKTVEHKKVPYISVHYMVKHLLALGIIKVEDQTLLWEISQTDLGYYFIGLAILQLTDYIELIPFPNPLPKGKPHILQIKRRIALSDFIIDDVKENFVFYIAAEKTAEFLKTAEGSYPKLKKFYLHDKNTSAGLYLLKKTVL